MQFIYDHLLASIAMGALLLTLGTLWASSSTMNTLSGGYYANRTHVVGTIEQFERDLRNLGAGAAASSPVIHAHTTTGGNTILFEFETVLDTAATASSERLRYTLETNPDSTFRLVRARQTTSGYETLTRGSVMLTRFEVDLLDAAGAPTAIPDSARAIHVMLESVDPFGGSDRPTPTPSTIWQTTYYPTSLALR